MYSGNIVNLDLSIKQIINKADKERKMMSIIVIAYNTIPGNNNRILSTHVICPICKENARFEIKDFRIKIFKCKNGHVVDDIILKDFENTQMIDESLIICDKCKVKNKSNTYNNEMYRCNKCNLDLCPLCKSTHDKSHKIIDYGEKDFICNEHNKEYNSYCEICNKDMCTLCKQKHKKHKIILYDEMTIPEGRSEALEAFDTAIKWVIKTFKAKIEMIIDRLNNVIYKYGIIFKNY